MVSRMYKGVCNKIVMILVALALICQGCVERTITINTYPQGAKIWLNDELVGTSPTTVTFQWYGDYRIKITKPGYQTLVTHQQVSPPWYDAFPFDFFAQVIWPGHLLDNHQWSFVLQQAQPISHDELANRAKLLRQELVTGQH